MERNVAAIPIVDSKIQFTTEDGLLLTLPQDLEYNKTECTDVSIISTTEAKPKMPLVAHYTPLTSTLPLFRKDKIMTLNPSDTSGSKVSSLPSPYFAPKEENDQEERLTSVLPRDNSNFLDAAKPKIFIKSERFSELSKSIPETLSIKFTSNKVLHTNSSSSSSESSIEEPAGEMISFQENLAFDMSKVASHRLQVGHNPRGHRKSISLNHPPIPKFPSEKKMPGSFSWYVKNLEDENRSPPPRLEKGRQGFLKRTSLFRFRLPNREPSGQALGMINDKSHFSHRDPRTPSMKTTRRESIPKITRILKKHAFSGELTQSSTQLFNIIAALKKKRMSPLERFVLNFRKTYKKLGQQLQILAESLKYFLTPMRPDSLWRSIWDGLILVFIIISLITTPFRLCFRLSNTVIEDDEPDELEILSLVVFLLDILMNFRTAYYMDGNLVFGSRNIAFNYLKNWFFFDLIASFPYQLVGNALQEHQEAVYDVENKVMNPFKSTKFLVKFLGMLQLIRIFKLRIILVKFESYIDLNRLLNGIVSLLKLFLMVSFIAHWCACGWHLLAIDSESSDWLTKTGLERAPTSDRYIASLYFCLTTLLTVGYGDISPQTSVERVYTIFVMLLGGCVFGYVMNSIAVIIYSLEDENTKTRNKITSLCKYMQKEGLAKDVQQDIRKYLEFMFEGRNAMKQSDKEMLEILSEELRGRFYEQMNGRLLYGNKLLANNFTKRALHRISASIEERTYIPQEPIFDSADPDCSIYYISRGHIDFLHVKGTAPVLSLKTGTSFGEISFFTGVHRALFAKSVEFSRLLFIKRAKFLEVLESFPQDKEMFCLIKDRILNYQDYSVLNLRCAICREDDHLLEKCPEIRYVPDVLEILRGHLERVSQFKSEFKRNRRKKFHVLSNLKAIEVASLNVYKTHFDKLLEIKGGGEELASIFEEADEPQEKVSRSIGRPSISLPLGRSNIISDPMYKNSRFSMIEKDVSKEAKQIWTALYSRKLEELKIIRENALQGDLAFKVKDEGPTLPFEEIIDLEYFEFDRVKNYPVYFPHNNINKIIDRLQKKEKHSNQSSEEIKKLKTHLRRFFKALEKQKQRDKIAAMPLRRGRSRSFLRMFEKEKEK